MDQLPAFGVRLKRLFESRGIGADRLARRATVTEAEIGAVLAGGEPSPQLLRRLAPVLSLHRSDLFVIAGRRVPADLAPADPGAVIDIAPRDLGALTGVEPAGGGRDVTETAALIWDARRLTAGGLDQVRDRAHALRKERAAELAPDRRCRCPGP